MAKYRRIAKVAAANAPDDVLKDLHKPKQRRFTRNFWVQGAQGTTGEDGKLLEPYERVFSGGSMRILGGLDLDLYQRHGTMRKHVIRIESRAGDDGALVTTVVDPNTGEVFARILSHRDGKEI